MHRYVINVLEELGIVSFYNSPLDIKLLCTQRFVRLFAYGGSALILVFYLEALGISYTRSGIFMTLTLVGDMLISFCLTLVADSLGRKPILALGAALMAASGVVFAMSGNYWVLLAAAIFGVISPSGSEIGPFRSIEESTLAHLTPATNRSDIYAWYCLTGAVGTAFGLITCGRTVQYLQSLNGWSDVQACRVIFYAYAALGLINLALVLALSKKIEAEVVQEPVQPDPETAPLLESNGRHADSKLPTVPRRYGKLLPSISTESRGIIISLCVLFGMDAMGTGFMPLTWLTTYFKHQFGLEEDKLGSLFFTTSLIAAFSTIIASSISKRIGNVKTMVFTHLPSSIALALLPVPSPAHLDLAITLLVLRACTTSMDMAPRSAFLAAIILPHERTAVMGFLNVVKTASSSIGPSLTGLLFQHRLYWVSFVAAGGLKVVYDLAVLVVFRGHIAREDREELDGAADANGTEEGGEAGIPTSGGREDANSSESGGIEAGSQIEVQNGVQNGTLNGHSGQL